LMMKKILTLIFQVNPESMQLIYYFKKMFLF
jgi:hypothetical protein